MSAQQNSVGGESIVPEGNSNGDIAINVGQGAAGDIGISTSTQIARMLFCVGFLTMVMAVATALYQQPRGVVFESHRLAYYLTLGGIFAAGVAEVSTAFWLSGTGQANGRLVSFARGVLFASMMPLAGVIALGGFSILMKKQLSYQHVGDNDLRCYYRGREGGAKW
jgi:hypothetical protein